MNIYILALFIVFWVGLAWVWITLIKFQNKLRAGEEVARKTRKYERIGHESGQKILILGDSIAVGVGASVSDNSLAGLIGQAYPDASIENFGENEMRTSLLARHIDDNLGGKEYDLIVIATGSNDIVQLRSTARIESELRKIIKSTCNSVRRVVLFTTGNAGTVHIMPSLLKPFMSWRAKRMRKIAVKLEQQYKNLIYVDIGASFLGKTKESNDHYGKDNFYLSDMGYQAWFEALQHKLQRESTE